jgi:hypothetical protein
MTSVMTLGKVAEYTSEVGNLTGYVLTPAGDWVMWAPNHRESYVFLRIIGVSSSVHRFQSEQKLACVTGIIPRTLIMSPLSSQDCRLPQFMWKLAL